MADPSGVQAALTVEAVEWEPAEGGKLTIRVRGRWRRRRPEWRGQPLLGIEAEGQRHRFPATPVPPSLTGAPPGSWEMTFSVPAWLAPYLGGRIWLQLGLALIPLPAPVGGEPPAAERAAADTEALSDRRVRSAELAAERWRERHAETEAIVGELTARAQRLEQELERARREPARLRTLIADRDQQRRAAEQRAHAEQALRIELQEALDAGAAAARERARVEAGELAAAEARVRELEDELEELNRRAANAGRAAAAPPVAAPPAAAPTRPPVSTPFDLDDELAVAARAWPAIAPAPAAAVAAVAQAEYRALVRERLLASAHAAPATAVLAQPRVPASAPPGEDPELSAVLGELRRELEQLAQLAEHERAGRVDAERRVGELEHRVTELERALRDRELRSARVYDAVHELRGLLDRARGEGAAGSRGDVEPERFDAALSRLRASAPKQPDVDPETEADAGATATGAFESPPVAPWLRAAFERLTATDPERAGRLLVGLLPAQGAVHPEPIAYDLLLGEHDCVQLTLVSAAATPEIVAAEQARALSDVTFRATGNHAALARLVAAGRLRARLGRAVAKVEGDRRGLAALRALVRSRLTLEQLYDACVRLEPGLALTLAAVMVRPEWTREERFTVAYDPGTQPGRATYLHVRRGEQLTVTDTPPLGPVVATIVCPPGELLAVLAGELRPDVSVRGDATPLLALLGWLERAQRE